MKGAFSKFFSLIAVLTASFPAFAGYSEYGIPDSSEIRKELVENWFEAPLSAIRMNHIEIRTSKAGKKFQVRLEETEENFSIIVAPFAKIDVDIVSDKGTRTETQEVYPCDAPGAWVLIRDKKSGKAQKIRYYFASDSEIYVQFSPVEKTAVADFVIYNCYAARGIPTGVPFSYFYSASFDQIVHLTSRSLPWQYSKVSAEDYEDTMHMVATIQEKLPKIAFEEDAMYDGEGNPIYITTGKPRKVPDELKDKATVSGMGFLKLVADGIALPLVGGGLERDPLIEETVKYSENSFQGIKASEYGISFALDWIRNLATAISSIRNRHNYKYEDSTVDVEIEPFTSEWTENGLSATYGYIKNSGYSMHTLKSLLYVLAVTEPDTFYFAAIRETDRSVSPELKVFNECAMIFPFFDNNGHFCVVVFKDGAEIPFDEFYGRYCMDTVCLTKCKSTTSFILESIAK